MRFDVIVVGLGAMGSAALYQASQRASRVLGIDRYAPPHPMGSSHAESRITRLAVGEGPEYVHLVHRSHEIWREIESLTGRPLLYLPGVCIVAPGDASSTAGSHWDRFVDRTERVASGAGIAFERPSVADARRRFPQLLLRDDDLVGFEPSGGVVLCERAIESQLARARAAGAQICLHEAVKELEPHAHSVRVVTEKDVYEADKVIVTAGPWIARFFPETLRQHLRVTRQLVFWFEVEDSSRFSVQRFPGVVWLGDTPDEYLGLFPIPPGGRPGLKMLSEQHHVETHADSVPREVTGAEIDDFYQRFAARRVAGVTARCLEATVCLYTSTPDHHFLIDAHPDTDRIMLASPCSGHGFKHSAAIGEALAQWATGHGAPSSLAPFAATRLSKL